MGLRTLTSLQKVLLAVIVFILVGYVGYFVVKGSSPSNPNNLDESVADVAFFCSVANNGKSSGKGGDSWCEICNCPAAPAALVGSTVWVDLNSQVDLYRRGGNANNLSIVGSKTVMQTQSSCNPMTNSKTGSICSVKLSSGQQTVQFLIQSGSCSDYFSGSSENPTYAQEVATNVTVYNNSEVNAIPRWIQYNKPNLACNVGSSTNTPGTNPDNSTSGLLPGCGIVELDGSANQCGVGGSLEGQCVNDAMWQQGYLACVRQTGGGGGAPAVQPFPSVRCTNLGSYVDPETGKAGRKKCAPNAEGSPRICLETSVPVRGNASSGNGRCIEKNNAAGQVCRFGIQCALEKTKAPGLSAEYEVTGQSMRCERRDNESGGIEAQGICLPRFRGADIGCGVQGDTDAERDAYCKEVFAEYETITEGENNGKDYEKLDFSERAYCHKVRNAAGTEVVNRFACRLQRGLNKPCNPNGGNMCQDGLTCAIVKGQNKYACQVPLSR